MSFCILTLIISPGLPRMPPKNPAVAAMARRTGKSIGSPFGDILCLRICWCIITNHICLTLNLWVYLLASVRSRHLYRIGSQYLRTFTIVFYQPQSGKVTGGTKCSYKVTEPSYRNERCRISAILRHRRKLF